MITQYQVSARPVGRLMSWSLLVLVRFWVFPCFSTYGSLAFSLGRYFSWIRAYFLTFVSRLWHAFWLIGTGNYSVLLFYLTIGIPCLGSHKPHLLFGYYYVLIHWICPIGPNLVVHKGLFGFLGFLLGLATWFVYPAVHLLVLFCFVYFPVIPSG